MTEKDIDENRERYRPVAYRGAIMYFCVRDFNEVDPMYQYSLQWFTNLFVQARLASIKLYQVVSSSCETIVVTGTRGIRFVKQNVGDVDHSYTFSPLS